MEERIRIDDALSFVSDHFLTTFGRRGVWPLAETSTAFVGAWDVGVDAQLARFEGTAEAEMERDMTE